MSCREYRGELIELARGWAPNDAEVRSLAAHLDRCAGCERFFAEQQALSAAEKRLGEAPILEADDVGARVMAEFDRAQRTSVSARRIAVAGLAAAACIAMGVWLGGRAPARPQAAAASDVSQEAPFLPIPYTVPLAPGERTTVVRMEIPVPSLIAAGFRVGAHDPAALVEADVLVSQDGRARAIRPIAISNSN